MKFVKGVLIGGVISAGALMLYAETTKGGQKMMKQGKKIFKSMM